MNSIIWGVAPRAAMFCRDVTKREVSSLFSMVAVWLRWVRLADQNQLVLPSPSSTQTMDGWAPGHGPPTLHRRPASLSPSFRSSLAFPWRLNRTCASLWRQPLALVVVVVCCCLFVEAPPFPSNRLSACDLRPLIRHVPCLSSTFRVLSVFVWLEVSRAKTNDWAAAFDRQKSRDISVCIDIYSIHLRNNDYGVFSCYLSPWNVANTHMC